MFRSILVHVSDDPGASTRLRLAIDLAKQFDATLSGVAAALPTLPLEAYSTIYGIPSTTEFSGFDRQHIEAEFGKAARTFADLTKDGGLETSWQASFEPPSIAVARAAVGADLVVVGASTAGSGRLGPISVGETILRAGRPVLVVPPKTAAMPIRPHIVIAWKDGTEARRAVADAIPFLKRGASVSMVQVGEPGERDTDLAGITSFLLRHGIAVKSEVVSASGVAVDERILGYARDANANMIVAGAYSHTRVRELVFGGVTRGLLTKSEIPCLFSR